MIGTNTTWVKAMSINDVIIAIVLIITILFFIPYTIAKIIVYREGEQWQKES